MRRTCNIAARVSVTAFVFLALLTRSHSLVAQDDPAKGGEPDGTAQEAEPKEAEPKEAEPKEAEPKEAESKEAESKEAESKEAESKAEPGKDRPKAAVFAKALGEWKQELKTLLSIKVKYQDARSDAVADAAAEEWDAQLVKSEAKLKVLREAAVAAFLEAPGEDTTLSNFLLHMLNDDVAADRYEEAYPIALAMTEQPGAANPDLVAMAASVCFCVNDFERSETLYKRAREMNAKLNNDQAGQLANLAAYKKYWKEEQEARKRDEESVAPRVRMTTNRGVIELELFENEAPGAVGNFIYLIEERKFYDDLTFHRVIAQFMAQGGCPDGTGTGGPGYNIYCECREPNHRKHFRGSLSMAHAGQDTGGSQFFLTFTPTAHLNGKHTVFGRVVSGMDVLAKIRRREPNAKTPPDRILTAEVIRKDKDKTYEPNRVP